MPDKMQRLTDSSRMVLKATEKSAKALQSSVILPVHLLLGMTRTENTDACLALEDYDIIDSKLLPFVKLKRPPQENLSNKIDLSDGIKTVLELSHLSATEHAHFWIGSGHLLIGLLRHEDSMVSDVLAHFGVQRRGLIMRTEAYLEDYDLQDKSLIAYRKLQLQPSDNTGLIGFFRRIFSNNRDNR